MSVLNPSISPAIAIAPNADRRTGALALAREEFRDKFPLRLGVYLLLGGLWLYGVLLLQDAVKVATTQLKAAQSLRLRAESVAKEGDWAARALAAKEAVVDAQGVLWREESAGLAQALVNDQIANSLAQARITPRLLTVANVLENKPATGAQEVMIVRAKTQFEFKQREFYAWLEKLARDRAERKPSFVVDAISVRGLPTPLVEVDLTAYVLRAKVPKAVLPPPPLSGLNPTIAGAK
jgi:hypothetical protein